MRGTHTHQWAPLLSSSLGLDRAAPVKYNGGTICWVTEFQPSAKTRDDSPCPEKKTVSVHSVDKLGLLGLGFARSTWSCTESGSNWHSAMRYLAEEVRLGQGVAGVASEPGAPQMHRQPRRLQ